MSLSLTLPMQSHGAWRPSSNPSSKPRHLQLLGPVAHLRQAQPAGAPQEHSAADPASFGDQRRRTQASPASLASTPGLFFAVLARLALSSGSGSTMDGFPSTPLPRPHASPQTQDMRDQRGEDPPTSFRAPAKAQPPCCRCVCSPETSPDFPFVVGKKSRPFGCLISQRLSYGQVQSSSALASALQ